MRNIEMLKIENKEIMEDLEKESDYEFSIMESIRDKIKAEYWGEDEEVIHSNGVLWGAIIMLEAIKERTRRPASWLAGASNDD